jgi:uncharacterized protein (TIGR02001 family)
MSQKTLSGLMLTLGLISAPVFAADAAPAAPASPHTFTGNVTLASEYLYRGIAQTRGNSAIQGGFDYSHASGLYAGTWASNISWISDSVNGAVANQSTTSSLEIDVYGGYKGSISSDLGYDVGVLTYNYPGSGKTVSGFQQLNQDTTELYGALSWKWLSLKYSHSTTALFGWAKNNGAAPNTLNDKTTGSGYLELNAAYDLGNGWGINGHMGNQKVKGYGDASYSDYKLGVTKDLGFGTVGLAYSTTNAKDNCSNSGNSNPYCYVMGTNANNKYEAGKDRAVLTFTKTF